MLNEVCMELNNFFLPHRENDIYTGIYTIEGGRIEPLSFLSDGQYMRIVGSRFNDGVWQYPSDILRDETFDGAIWAMSIPPDVIEIAAEIEEWEREYGGIINAPYQSESFGNYRYDKGYSGVGGTESSWKKLFYGKLSRYRRISVL